MRQIALAAILLLAGCGAKKVDEYPELELARRQGLITTVEQAERYNMPLPGDVSPLYLERRALIDSPDIVALGNSKTPKEAGERLAKIEPILGQLSPMGESADYAPQRQWRKGFDADFSELGRMKNLVKAFTAISWYYFDRRDIRTGMRFLSMATNIAKQSSKERSFVGKLMYTALTGMVRRGVLRAAAILRNDKEEIDGLITLAGKLSEPNYKESLGYEIVFLRCEMDLVRQKKKTLTEVIETDPGLPKSLEQALARGYIATADPTAIEREYVATIAALARAWNDRDEVRRLEGALAKDAKNLRNPNKAVASIFLIAFDQAKVAELRQVAELRTMKLALAALLIRLETGQWPALRAVGARANEPTVDPFRKADLIYKTAPTGITMYSVGPDGVDSGGLVRTGLNKNGAHDLAVTRLPAPN